MEDGSAVSIVDRRPRANLTAQGSLAHTCLRTTAGFSWYRKANRQKARGELDLPFHHLSMELLTKCPEAGLDERRDPSPINGVQSTWFSARCGKTRNRLVSCTHTCWAKRWWVDETRYQNKKRRLVINCPPVQKNYAKNMNGVDRNDRDSADYTTSIRINRWYLRIFFWVLDSDLLVLHHRRLPRSERSETRLEQVSVAANW
jgi:hypothetical protein